MPLIETKGAASAQGFGEFAQSAAPVYIEDVFSTYLYTGDGSTQTITNGIDLSGKGGLVWIKSRSNALDNAIYDTARGNTKVLFSNVTVGDSGYATTLTAFNSNGFSVDKPATGTAVGVTNTNAYTYVSWTFRKQAKFFDVVTYTGNGSNRTISHNLGSVPGCIIVKRTDTTADWQVYHRSLANTEYLVLNSTAAKATGATRWNSTTPTSTEFSLGTDTTVNASGGTYVAYLFAHDAGGFGLSGSDNVISCGSYTGNGSANGPEITLGYEPQWVLIKSTASAREWVMADVMRGMSLTNNATLLANQSLAESTSTSYALYPTATGFKINANGVSVNSSGATYIYIAIRRGPMKVPTSGTSVYQPLTGQPNGSGLFAHNILTDFSFYHFAAGTQNWGVQDRLRGSPDLSFNTTAAENGLVGGNKWDVMTGYINPNPGSGAYDSWAFRRAPGFMDVVCYTGTGNAVAQNHNLSAVPELVIVKKRTAPGYGQDWYVRAPTCVANGDGLILNSTAAQTSSSAKIYSLTSTTFTVQNEAAQNTDTYVAYLFATVAGVSKVGSYTGSGTTKQIDCGFTGGARFVLIKRTDSTGDWYVYDSARGIVAGNDPYALLNSGAANVTSTDYVDTYSAGFELSSTAPAGLNANGGTYIFLAIA